MTEPSVIPDSFEGKICKILSDGTVNGTSVMLASGEVIPFVQEVEIKLNANNDNFAHVKLSMFARCDLTLPIAEVRHIHAKTGDMAVGDPCPVLIGKEPTYEPDGL